MAAGGDGTINEVINGMAGSDVPLAILPLGTTNVLAKELGIPEDLKGAMDTAVSRKPRTVSLGRIELNPETDSAFSRYFCLMAGIGFDGEAVHGMNKAVKKRSGKAAYIFSGLKNLLRYSPNQLFYNIDGKEYTGFSSITGKASKYGGNFKITPDADLSDPFLYTCIFQGNRRRDLLRYVFKVITGRLFGGERCRIPEISRYRSARHRPYTDRRRLPRPHAGKNKRCKRRAEDYLLIPGTARLFAIYRQAAA